MLIGIFGESCVGKSTLADKLKVYLNAEVYTGKDFLRLDKNEAAAKAAFQRKLQDAVTADNSMNIIYVITEKEYMELLPENAIRILVTADIETIKERFAKRMGGKLPPPVAGMLERKHGCFDNEEHYMHIVSEQVDLDNVCNDIIQMHIPESSSK